MHRLTGGREKNIAYNFQMGFADPWARTGGRTGPRRLAAGSRAGLGPRLPARGLVLFGHDEVTQHVEGVAVRVHCHHLAVLLVNLKEPGIIQAHDPHLRAVGAAQADALSTENDAQSEVSGNTTGAAWDSQ